MNLPHKITLIVPSVSSGHALPPAIVKRAVEKTARTLAAEFKATLEQEAVAIEIDAILEIL